MENSRSHRWTHCTYMPLNGIGVAKTSGNHIARYNTTLLYFPIVWLCGCTLLSSSLFCSIYGYAHVQAIFPSIWYHIEYDSSSFHMIYRRYSHIVCVKSPSCIWTTLAHTIYCRLRLVAQLIETELDSTFSGEFINHWRDIITLRQSEKSGTRIPQVYWFLRYMFRYARTIYVTWMLL